MFNIEHLVAVSGLQWLVSSKLVQEPVVKQWQGQRNVYIYLLLFFVKL